jgi:hypothetical protein
MMGRVFWLGLIVNHAGHEHTVRRFPLKNGITIYRLICLQCDRAIMDYRRRERARDSTAEDYDRCGTCHRLLSRHDDAMLSKCLKPRPERGKRNRFRSASPKR